MTDVAVLKGSLNPTVAVFWYVPKVAVPKLTTKVSVRLLPGNTTNAFATVPPGVPITGTVVPVTGAGLGPATATEVTVALVLFVANGVGKVSVTATPAAPPVPVLVKVMTYVAVVAAGMASSGVVVALDTASCGKQLAANEGLVGMKGVVAALSPPEPEP